MLIDPAISASSSFFLAALLAASAAHKARTYTDFIGVIDNYRIAPRGCAFLIAPAILIVEIAIAVCLLHPALRPTAASLAAALFVIYGAAIAINLLRGRTAIDCGCSFGAGGDRLTWSLVVRNLALVGAGLLAAAPTGPRNLGLVDAGAIGVSVFVCGLIYLTAETLRANWTNFIAAGYR